MKPRVILFSLLACLLPLQAGAPTGQQVENLRAFAKLYGYVRYFHPSDEAAGVNWDALAVHGASQVLDATDRAALKQALQDVFGPIAPTLRIYEEGQEPAPIDLTGGKDPASLQPVAWQHQGVTVSDRASTYQSGRTNRARTAPTGNRAGFGNLSQGMDAKDLRGAKIKLEGKVRADVKGIGNQAQLWLRVDNPSRSGFFNNMGDRPVTSKEWQTYAIEGTVADDADRIAYGAFLKGSGVMNVDNLTLSVKRGDGWELLPTKNPSFEEGESGTTGWTTRI